MDTLTIADTTFYKDVMEGLSKEKKTLSSKYFYDEIGDGISQEIMAMPSYYLTNSEQEILENQSEEILKLIPDTGFSVLELGAGDGQKTKHFLKASTLNKAVTYRPVDISANVLEINKENVSSFVPDLKIRPICDDYFRALSLPDTLLDRRLVLFMGSNIGNYTKKEAVDFLIRVTSEMLSGDYLLIGIDLKKDPSVILDAYDDPEGITARFNMNLLRRINKELEANFDTTKFKHYASYNPANGECASFVISLENQEVRIGDKEFSFTKGEEIHMEISMKYSLQEIRELAVSIGLQICETFQDEKGFYSLSLMKKA